LSKKSPLALVQRTAFLKPSFFFDLLRVKSAEEIAKSGIPLRLGRSHVAKRAPSRNRQL
jgi:hypothetical protein